MNFNEWMKISEQVIGEEGMYLFEQFASGNISLDKCIEQMCEVMTQKNKNLLRVFVESIST